MRSSECLLRSGFERPARRRKQNEFEYCLGKVFSPWRAPVTPKARASQFGGGIGERPARGEVS